MSTELGKPGSEHYILELEGCVEPSLIGPYATLEAAQTKKEELVDAPGNGQNSYTTLTVPCGIKIGL